MLALEARHEVEEDVGQFRIELAALQRPDFGESVGDLPGLLVWALVRERIEDVSQRADPSSNRNRCAAELHRITRAVPALVVMARDFLGDVHLGDVRLRENLGAGRSVRFHDLALAGRQLARLEQDRIRNDQLADVVQACGEVDRESRRRPRRRSPSLGLTPTGPRDSSVRPSCRREVPRRPISLFQQQDAVSHQLAFAQLDAELAAVVGHCYVDGAGGEGRLFNLLLCTRCGASAPALPSLLDSMPGVRASRSTQRPAVRSFVAGMTQAADNASLTSALETFGAPAPSDLLQPRQADVNIADPECTSTSPLAVAATNCCSAQLQRFAREAPRGIGMFAGRRPIISDHPDSRPRVDTFRGCSGR